MSRVPVLMQGDHEWYLRSPGVVTGRQLRYLLTTLLLEAGRPLTVRELVERCESEGVVFERRASKVVSDALRWEIGWCRVTRMSRGVYRAYRWMIPRSTGQWIAKRVGQLRAYFAGLRTLAVESLWLPPAPDTMVQIT